MLEDAELRLAYAQEIAERTRLRLENGVLRRLLTRGVAAGNPTFLRATVRWPITDPQEVTPELTAQHVDASIVELAVAEEALLASALKQYATLEPTDDFVAVLSEARAAYLAPALFAELLMHPRFEPCVERAAVSIGRVGSLGADVWTGPALSGREMLLFENTELGIWVEHVALFAELFTVTGAVLPIPQREVLDILSSGWRDGPNLFHTMQQGQLGIAHIKEFGFMSTEGLAIRLHDRPAVRWLRAA